MRTLHASLFAVSLLGAQVSQALACACCTDPGHRSVAVTEITPFEIEELERLHLSGRAGLYLSACGEDCIEGLTGPATVYKVDFSQKNGVWTLLLTGVDAQSIGALRLTLPDRVERRAVDPAPEPDVMQPELSHEWRLAVPVSGQGAFAAADGAVGVMVLMGTGNHCVMAESFSHWHLAVTAPGVNFSLFGRLDQP